MEDNIMICEHCGAKIPEDETYCKKCDKENSLEQEKILLSLDKLNQKKTDFILYSCHSPLMCAVAILFTLATICKVPVIFTNGILFGAIELVQFIFMIITSIGLWGCYKAKTTHTLTTKLKQCAAYDSFCAVYLLIWLWIICIIVAILSIFTLPSILGIPTIIDAIEDIFNTSQDSYIDYTGFLVIPMCGVAICFCVFGIGMHLLDFPKTRKGFFLSTKETLENDSEKPADAPLLKSCTWGLFLLLPSVISIVCSHIIVTFLGDINNTILGSSSSQNILTDILLFLSSIISNAAETMVARIIISNIPSILLGLALILSGVWMHKLRKGCDLIFCNKNKLLSRLCELQDESEERFEKAEVRKAEIKKKKLAEKEKKLAQRELELAEKESKHSKEAAMNINSDATCSSAVKFSISINGKASPLIELDRLIDMAVIGELQPDTLVWTKGMSNWVRAGTIPELNDSFPPTIECEELETPPIPNLEIPEEN